MESGKRRTFTSDERVRILRRPLLDHVPVSDLCDEYSLMPNVFYRWQREFFEHQRRAPGTPEPVVE